jgi:hypothetical protein
MHALGLPTKRPELTKAWDTRPQPGVYRPRPPVHATLLILDESFALLDPENLALASRCVFNRAPA